ncbi:MAG: HDOD domain-containing protein [Thiobacillus sp.]
MKLNKNPASPMISDDSQPSRIIGGGISTSESEQPVVVTQMLGISNTGPVREETLRARFLSFDPLFDAASNLVAQQLILRGRMARPDSPAELRQMDEDMLLTGLFSLVQGGLSDELPLFVQISCDLLFTDVLKDLNHRKLVWIVDLDSEQHLARALALQDAGLTFCPHLNRSNPVILDSASAWTYVACHADETPIKGVRARYVVDGVQHAQALARWPDSSWFKGSLFSGDTAALPTGVPQPPVLSREQALQLDLLAIALRGSPETLAQFFRLNPDMAPRFLAIANSPVGGLSRPAESAVHALVMLGAQRAGRVAAVLALSGVDPTDESRQAAISALTRALFLGKITRLGAPAENAAIAFEIGLLSIAPHALSLPIETLVRKLGLAPAAARALSGQPTSEGLMLKLTHACEVNDSDALAAYAEKLRIPLHQISVAYLDALIAASALDAALH